VIRGARVSVVALGVRVAQRIGAHTDSRLALICQRAVVLIVTRGSVGDSSELTSLRGVTGADRAIGGRGALQQGARDARVAGAPILTVADISVVAVRIRETVSDDADTGSRLAVVSDRSGVAVVASPAFISRLDCAGPGLLVANASAALISER
jgi:hypothetical protein